MYIEKLNALFHKAPHDIDDIIDYSKSMVKYVNTVISHQMRQEQNRIYLISGRIEQQEYIQKLEQLNYERNKIHDEACIACHNINVVAERNHMNKIFDFKLEVCKDKNGIIKGMSQNNHYCVSQFCAQFVNEFYEKGTKEYNDKIMDEIADRDKFYPEKELLKLNEVAAEWVERLENSKISPYIENGTKDIFLQDDVHINIIKNNLDYTVDVQISGKGTIDEISPDNAFFFDQYGYGADIPISVIQEIVIEHGGIDHEKTKEYAQEKETSEMSFEDKLKKLGEEIGDDNEQNNSTIRNKQDMEL